MHYYPDLWWYYCIVLAVGCAVIVWIILHMPAFDKAEMTEREEEGMATPPVITKLVYAVTGRDSLERQMDATPPVIDRDRSEDRAIRLSPYPYRTSYPPFINTTLSPMRKPLRREQP